MDMDSMTTSMVTSTAVSAAAATTSAAMGGMDMGHGMGGDNDCKISVRPSNFPSPLSYAHCLLNS